MPSKRSEWLKENEKLLTSRKYENKVGEKFAETLYDARDLETLHGTYQFEQRMLDYVRKGKTEELKKLLLEYPNNSSYAEGKVAVDELRQAKNIFVALVAMIGKEGAIKGGMPVEEAYHLIDTYTQQCEELSSVEDVYILQYNMIIDFSQWVEHYRRPYELSPLVMDCVNYISFHLNEPIRAEDVISHSERSRSSLSEQFRKETGVSIGTFITNAKIDEAKSLLRYTDKPIAEIGAYLSFSSQPYFQNVFRKVTGKTPREYRCLKEEEPDKYE